MNAEIIKKRLGVIACPACRKQGFSVRVKSEAADGENVYSAGCDGCHYSFPISTENRLYQLSNPETGDWLRRFPCPQCSARGAEIDFRCTLSVRDSRLFLHCSHCRAEFNEKMAMEAYE